MKLGIDFKAVAMKAGGHAAGAALAGKLNSVSFINKIANPTTQGLVKAAIGYIAIPMLAKKMKLSGGKKGDILESVGEGVGMIGILQAGRSKFPAIFPKVEGVEGYEANPIQGLGELEEVSGTEDEDISGYETDPISGSTSDADLDA